MVWLWGGTIYFKIKEKGNLKTFILYGVAGIMVPRGAEVDVRNIQID